eukprot:144118-Prymnesium_polylepis.2
MLHLVDRVYPFALDHASHTRQLPHSHLAAARRRARRCPVLPAEQRGGDARVLGLHDLDDVADLQTESVQKAGNPGESMALPEHVRG